METAVVSAPGAVGGGQWRDHQQVVSGIIWKYRTQGALVGYARPLWLDDIA
jgi:hypothetical protein